MNDANNDTASGPPQRRRISTSVSLPLEFIAGAIGAVMMTFTSSPVFFYAGLAVALLIILYKFLMERYGQFVLSLRAPPPQQPYQQQQQEQPQEAQQQLDQVVRIIPNSVQTTRKTTARSPLVIIKRPETTMDDDDDSSSVLSMSTVRTHETLKPFCQDYVDRDDDDGEDGASPTTTIRYAQEEFTHDNDTIELDDVRKMRNSVNAKPLAYRKIVRSRTPSAYSASGMRRSPNQPRVDDEGATCDSDNDMDGHSNERRCGNQCSGECGLEEEGRAPVWPIEPKVVHQEAEPEHFMDAFKRAYSGTACEPAVSEINEAVPTAAKSQVKKRQPLFAPQLDQCALEKGAVPGWGFRRDRGPIIEPTGFARDVAPFAAHPPSQYEVGVMAVSASDQVAGAPENLMASKRLLGFFM